MDNYTLLLTLIIILAVNAVFTVLISRNTGSLGRNEWRFSAFCLFAGFFLILKQKQINIFITVSVANYLLLLGFYYQTSVALIMEYKKKVINPYFIRIISIVFWGSFIYFSFINFNTSIRIIIISSLMSVFYINAAVLMLKHYKTERKTPYDTQELFYLFCFSALFYIGRSVFTAIDTNTVTSLIDKNITTTVSFLFVIVFNLVNMTGLFNASLRIKNNMIVLEKEKLSSLFGFLNDTAKHLNLEDLYKSIEEILKTSMNIDSAAIFLIDENKETHSIAHVFNKLDLPLTEVKTLKKGEGSSGKAIEEDRVIVMKVEDYPIKSVSEAYRAKGVTHMVSVPLKTSEGIIGAISIIYTDEIKSNFLDRDFFYYLGEQIALVLHNAFLFERVSLLANRDPLTGLYNRRSMMEILKQEYTRAKRSEKGYTIVMADIDHFKSINDNFGHECGDEVLTMLANIFREECRDYDSICRWGGEEFLLLIIDSDLPSTVRISDRIRLRLEQLRITCTEKSHITISMGITAFNMEYTLEQSIANADEALYRAKKNGRNRIEKF